jgi:uncharacterized protein YjiS (DUF1127 family)
LKEKNAMDATRRALMNISELDFLGFSGRAGGWLGGCFHKFAGTIQSWSRRCRTRRDLLEMDDHILKDIGINRIDALQEGRKAFWKG